MNGDVPQGSSVDPLVWNHVVERSRTHGFVGVHDLMASARLPAAEARSVLLDLLGRKGVRSRLRFHDPIYGTTEDLSRIPPRLHGMEEHIEVGVQVLETDTGCRASCLP
jgi:hypothetical protein